MPSAAATSSFWRHLVPWLGFEKLLYVIVVSAVLFILYAAIKRQRSGAYGPAIAIAGIIVAFYFF